MAIHDKYDQLTEREQALVDVTLSYMGDRAKDNGIALAGDDRAERAAEALAVWIVSSRDET